MGTREINTGVHFGQRVVLLILAALAIGIVVKAVPVWMAKPDRNLIDRSLNGDAAIKALTLLKQEQRADLLQREKKRLAAEPFDTSALNNLAVLESLSSNTNSAEAYALESASRTLRDTQSQIIALQLYLTKRDFAKAMYHLDGILVSDPKLGESIFPSVALLLANDEAGAQLAVVLNRNPPWRKDFLFWLNANDASDQTTFKLFNQMRKQGGDATTSEVREYLRKLMGRKDYDRAYFVWLDSLDQTALLKAGNVFDGNFDLDAKNQFFDWTLHPFTNGEIGVVPKRGDDKDRMLRLSFYNATAKFSNVEQHMRIGPGTYRFDGEESANSLKVEAGLKLVISCAESGKILGESPAFRDSAPWQKFSFGFTVPTGDCTTQVLRLQSASVAILDAKLDGEILFDSFKVTAENKDQVQP